MQALAARLYGTPGLVNTHHPRSEVPALPVLRTWPSKPEELGLVDQAVENALSPGLGGSFGRVDD